MTDFVITASHILYVCIFTVCDVFRKRRPDSHVVNSGNMSNMREFRSPYSLRLRSSSMGPDLSQLPRRSPSRSQSPQRLARQTSSSLSQRFVDRAADESPYPSLPSIRRRRSQYGSAETESIESIQRSDRRGQEYKPSGSPQPGGVRDLLSKPKWLKYIAEAEGLRDEDVPLVERGRRC